MSTFMGHSTPFSYDQHLPYIDFSDYNLSKAPIYISLIRDTGERINSGFFYKRRAYALKSKSKSKAKDSYPLSNKVVIYFISINN